MSCKTSSECVENLLTESKKDISLIQAIILLDGQKWPNQNTYKNHDIQQFKPTPKNVDLAKKLAHKILSRPFRNLPTQSSLLLLLIQQMAICYPQPIKRSSYRFTQEKIKEYTGWSRSHLNSHLQRLEQKRYIHQKGKFVYELLYDGKKRGVRPYKLSIPKS